MKRFIAVLTTITLILAFSITSVFAIPSWATDEEGSMPPGLEKQGKTPYGIAKKIFDDLEGTPWAQKAIEKLSSKGLLKGRDKGKYEPAGATTKLEAIIMVLRIMGLETEALNETTLPSEYRGKNVSEWAVGYINIAYQKGILDEEDIAGFGPNEPAKRHEVAKYIVRALGYEAEALEHMNDDLKPIFADAPSIPEGSIGYVYVVYDLELMQGSNKGNNTIFNPMGTLTRAEMAVLFDRVDGESENETDEVQVDGEVTAIYEDSNTSDDVNERAIEIKKGGEEKSYEVAPDAIIYDADENAINYSDIEVGFYVLMIMTDNIVTYIEVVDLEEITELTGIITKLDLEGLYHITIGEDIYGEDTYRLLENADVTVDGVAAELSDLVIGMAAELSLTDNKVTLIDAANTGLELDGIIKEIEDGIITIELSDETEVAFWLSEDAVIEIDGEEADVDDLIIDDAVIDNTSHFEIVNNTVVTFDVTTPEEEEE